MPRSRRKITKYRNMPKYRRMRGGLFGWDTAKNWYGKAKDYWHGQNGTSSSTTSQYDSSASSSPITPLYDTSPTPSDELTGEPTTPYYEATTPPYDASSSASSFKEPMSDQPAPYYEATTPPFNSSPSSSSSPSSFGGRRTRRRKMRGGYSDYSPLNGLAYSASPISDIKTAQPHNWVGGRTKRRRGRKSKRSRK